MEKYLVHEAPVAGPATHVIVIGVGDYPHLLGGDGNESSYHDDMGQLTSPPVSARAVADWFVSEFHNPDAELSTVALLLSEKGSPPYVNPKTNVKSTPQLADFTQVEKAILAWKNRGNTEEKNLMIFFFCGHGVSQGSDYALLLSDYGASDDNPLKGAVDFSKLHQGMARCAATKQLYFVDACRASSDTLIESLGNAGQIIINPDARLIGRVQAPVYYATLEGAKAYGRAGQTSAFTTMLLKGLKGGAADDVGDDWRVSTTRLKEAIDRFMERAVAAGERRRQTPPTDHLTTFDFHCLGDALPPVDVYVQCQPAAANVHAAFTCVPDTAGTYPGDARPAGCKKPWILTVPTGTYQFSAAFARKEYRADPKRKSLRPPVRDVKLDVQ